MNELQHVREKCKFALSQLAVNIEGGEGGELDAGDGRWGKQKKLADREESAMVLSHSQVGS